MRAEISEQEIRGAVLWSRVLPAYESVVSTGIVKRAYI